MPNAYSKYNGSASAAASVVRSLKHLNKLFAIKTNEQFKRQVEEIIFNSAPLFAWNLE